MTLKETLTVWTLVAVAALLLAVPAEAAKQDCGDVHRGHHTAYNIQTSGERCAYARRLVGRYIRHTHRSHAGGARDLRQGHRPNRCSWTKRRCVYYSRRTLRVVRWDWTVPYRSALASWYDADGLGGAVACGGGTGGYFFAHKDLPCGYRMEICYRGCVVAERRDAGPYVGDREFDLDRSVRDAIGFDGVGYVRVREVK